MKKIELCELIKQLKKKYKVDYGQVIKNASNREHFGRHKYDNVILLSNEKMLTGFNKGCANYCTLWYIELFSEDNDDVKFADFTEEEAKNFYKL